jgi:3-isopropylmalate/(R)-2-methylmalate dehydratase small subunit
MDEFRRHCLLEGLDDIGITLRFADQITYYEERRGRERPFQGPAFCNRVATG